MKRRLLFSYLSITAFVLLVLEIPLGRVVRELGRAPAHERPAARRVRARASGRRSRSTPTPAPARPSARRSRRSPTDYRASAGGRVVIVDARRAQRRRLRHRRVAIGAATSRPAPRSAARSQGAEVSGTRSSQTLGRRRCSTSRCRSAPRPASRARCASRIPASVVDDQIHHIWLLLAATGGVVLGIVFLASLLLARSMTKPLGDLERRGRSSSGAGDLAGARRGAARARPSSPCSRESFNATAARLEQLVGAQRGVRRRRVAPAAHAARRAAAAAREPRGRRAAAPPPRISRARSPR